LWGPYWVHIWFSFHQLWMGMNDTFILISIESYYFSSRDHWFPKEASISFSNNSDFLYFAPFNQAKCTPLIKLWRHSYIHLHLSSCIKLWRYWPILVTKTSAAIGRTKPDIF
jgi:hypothetical protein